MSQKPDQFILSKAIKELQDIERSFNELDIDIEKAIGQHERALKIAKEIYQYLDLAENRLQSIDISKTMNVENNE